MKLFLKEANFEDGEKEYEAVSRTPLDENGFTNPYFGCSKQEFSDKILPEIIAYSKGKQLPEGWVPMTTYFLWKDEEIVGIFRLRHYLNAFLKENSGHIGYTILKEQRGKGFASEGLALLIKAAKELIPEGEIFLSVRKDNPASLRVQCKNGAVIHHEDEKNFYTRISIM